MHRGHARHGLGRTEIDRNQLGAEGRRTQHLAVQEPGQLHVRCVPVPPRDEVAPVHLGHGLAGHAPIRGRRERIVLDHGFGERLVLRELRVLDAAPGVPVVHAAVTGHQALAIDVPGPGRELEHHVARHRSHAAQFQVHGGRGAAAEGAHIPGHQVRVTHDQADPRRLHAQFLTHGLGQRSADVLPHLDFAGINRHRAGVADVQPGADLVRQFLAAESAAAPA
jgi:hypothetical protein